MKPLPFIFLFSILFSWSYGQTNTSGNKERENITAVINKYAEAREKKDTILLRSILTENIDQLVSTGEWREGINASVQGMLKSSANAPGTRALYVEKIRMINSNTAIVDCKYEIQNKDGTIRKMWSTFIVVTDKQAWKISAIRNMLPASQ